MDWISSVVVDSNGTIPNGSSRTFSAVDYPVFMIITWRVTKTISISATGTYLYNQTSVVNANGRLTPAYFIWLDSGATITISNNRTGPSSYDEVDFVTYKWDS